MNKEQEKSIFAILIKRDNNFIFLGTGFFIGYGGLFYTAGHVFRKVEKDISTYGFDNLFIAFPDSNSKYYKIKSLWYESFEIYKQKGPTYKDNAAGIVDFKNQSYLVINRQRPRLNETITSLGYHNEKKDRLHPIIGNEANLSEIKFRRTEVKVKYEDSLISDIRRDYEQPRENAPYSRLYNNCITIEPKLIKGESGCPLIDSNGLVSGILIGSPKFVDTSDVLLGKFCTKTVRYRTYYDYWMYEYLLYI